MNLGLKDKVVLITGARGGIGRECARAFAKEGAKLILATYHALEAQEQSEWEKELRTPCLIEQADLKSEESIEALFKKGLRRFGKIDVCVANAGRAYSQYRRIDQMEASRFDEIISVNFRGTWLTARCYFKFLNYSCSSSANLIFVGSSAGTFGEEGYSDYSASKAALVGLTKTLKNEIIRIVPNGRVNLIAPGWTRTPMSSELEKVKEDVDRAMSTHSLARIALPIEIANQILAIASDEISSMVTGHVISVDGGMEGRVIW